MFFLKGFHVVGKSKLHTQIMSRGLLVVFLLLSSSSPHMDHWCPGVFKLTVEPHAHVDTYTHAPTHVDTYTDAHIELREQKGSVHE